MGVNKQRQTPLCVHITEGLAICTAAIVHTVGQHCSFRLAVVFVLLSQQVKAIIVHTLDCERKLKPLFPSSSYLTLGNSLIRF